MIWVKCSKIFWVNKERNMKKIIALFFALLCLSTALFAEQKRMAPLDFPSTASNGMGGAHVAYTTGIYSLFVNPAALQWANQASILEISPALIGPLNKLAKSGSSIMDALKGNGGNSNPFGPLSDIIDDGKLSVGMDIRGPLSVGYTANGLGFGLFSRIFVDARIIGTDVDAAAYADMMLPFGMSFNVVRLQDHELAAGFVLKPFVRVMTAGLEMSALDFVSGGDFDVSAPILAGIGSDLGFLYRFKRDLALGLTLGDVYTFGAKMGDIAGSSPDNLYRVPLSFNLGAAYTFRLSNVWKNTPRALQSAYAAAMIDWHSMNNIFTWNDRLHRNPILDLGLGAEFGFFNFLKFRVGLHDMLPMIGLGLEPRVFKFNIALYGKELGSEPGINSTMALDLSIALRLDTKKRNWPWSKPLIK
jgi:hypothetical protein